MSPQTAPDNSVAFNLDEGALAVVVTLHIPEEKIIILERRHNKYRLELAILPDCSLQLTGYESNEVKFHYHFESIDLPNQPIDALIFIRFSSLTPRKTDIRINGQELNQYSPETQSRKIPYNLRERKDNFLAEHQLNYSNIKDENEKFFIQTLNDLALKIKTGSDYEIIKSFALLRQLLRDKSSILPNIFKKYDFNPIFKIIKSDYPKGLPLPTIHLVGAYASNNDMETESLTLDEFLKSSLIVVEGESFNIEQIIDAIANGLGGVHFFLENNQTRIKFKQLSNSLHNIQGQITLQLVCDIAKCTLDALEPLARTIVSQSLKPAA